MTSALRYYLPSTSLGVFLGYILFRLLEFPNYVLTYLGYAEKAPGESTAEALITLLIVGSVAGLFTAFLVRPRIHTIRSFWGHLYLFFFTPLLATMFYRAVLSPISLMIGPSHLSGLFSLGGKGLWIGALVILGVSFYPLLRYLSGSPSGLWLKKFRMTAEIIAAVFLCFQFVFQFAPALFMNSQVRGNQEKQCEHTLPLKLSDISQLDDSNITSFISWLDERPDWKVYTARDYPQKPVGVKAAKKLENIAGYWKEPRPGTDHVGILDAPKVQTELFLANRESRVHLHRIRGGFLPLEQGGIDDSTLLVQSWKSRYKEENEFESRVLVENNHLAILVFETSPDCSRELTNKELLGVNRLVNEFFSHQKSKDTGPS